MSIVDHPEEWQPDFQEYVFLARAASRFERDDVWKALCSGGLEAWGSSAERADFAPVRLSPMAFSNQAELKDQILNDCTIDVMDTHRPIRRQFVRRRVPVPHWIYVTRASLEQFAKSMLAATVPTETRAKAYLKRLLEGDPKMKREDAREACKQFKLSDQGFEDRVWPDAREAAGLPRKGKPGPKSRS